MSPTCSGRIIIVRVIPSFPFFSLPLVLFTKGPGGEGVGRDEGTYHAVPALWTTHITKVSWIVMWYNRMHKFPFPRGGQDRQADD